jgi:Helicase conserved C-terminal domain
MYIFFPFLNYDCLSVYALAPKLFGEYTAYTKQYCNARRGRFGWDVSGTSNADELHSKLRQIMVRRLKADVLDELPPKQRSIIPIKIAKSKRKECEMLMKELRETRQSIADLVGDDAYGANFEARKLMMQAYQASGVAKAEGVCEYLLEWIRGSGTQKVLIFAHHKAVMDAIENAVAKELKGGCHIRIDGSVNSQERALRVKKFQTCGTIKVAILSMTAAGVGLTLTAASSVMFAELHWTPGVLAQAEDRCHRISQKNAVQVMYLVCEDQNFSIDMQLWHMLGRKINKLGRVVDGAINAGMDAQKSSGSPGCYSTDKISASVQDELQSFFADNDQKNGKKSTTPVKGTITSFFAKQKSAEKIRAPTSEMTEIDKGNNAFSLNNIEWDCTACTFHNSQRKTNSGRLFCEICSAAFVSDTVIDLTANVPIMTVRHVTPQNNEKIPASQKTNCSAKTSSEKFGSSLKSSLRDLIVVDDVEDRQVAGRLYGLSVGDGVYNGKRQKLTHFPSQEENAESKKTALTFSVSKNSGRVTIHYADSGESSLVNFEIEQIVTTETADKMTEAKLARNGDSYISLQPKYDHPSIRKGKC